MSYFSYFPKILYNFNIDNEEVRLSVTDIALNVRGRKKILDSITLFNEYDIEENETIEMVSLKLYGTQFYHWILMILNERFDYVEDFPRNEIELLEYVNTKYPEGPYGQHMICGKIPHYEDKDGVVVDLLTKTEYAKKFNLSEPNLSNYYSNYKNSLIKVTNLEYETRVNESKRRIKVLDPRIISSVETQLKALLK